MSERGAVGPESAPLANSATEEAVMILFILVEKSNTDGLGDTDEAATACSNILIVSLYMVRCLACHHS
jgi:hypothetical protein